MALDWCSTRDLAQQVDCCQRRILLYCFQIDWAAESMMLLVYLRAQEEKVCETERLCIHDRMYGYKRSSSHIVFRFRVQSNHVLYYSHHPSALKYIPKCISEIFSQHVYFPK